ncbi:MAG: helix-turn-helix transcriptional regulator [Lentisphaeria bacterium]|nr:helix-turn-helix transcriptional regulator [Lentisphaeria bacterium]
MRKIVSRPEPSKLPELPLPIHIRSSGYNEAEFNWEENEGAKPFVQIFWCIQGAGEFFLPEKKIILRPGETFFRLPGELHHHRSCDPAAQWRYYWFTFDGPAAADFMLSYGYRQEKMYAGECPVELFLELEVLVRKSTPYAQRHALSVAAEILARMGGSDDEPPQEQLAHRFLAMARENMRNPSITIDALAGKLGVHRTTLNKHFAGVMKISPGEYLDMIRLEHALRLLRETDLSCKEIGLHSGLTNQSYFCKQIRQATGMTPQAYRRTAGDRLTCGPSNGADLPE